MKRGLRLLLILSAGLVSIAIAAAAGYHRRWGSGVGLDEWGELSAHSFGEGSTAIVILHGYGGSPDDLESLARQLAETVPARYILPRGTHRVAGGGWAWFQWPDEVGGEPAHRQSILAARRGLLELVGRARSEGAGRIYIVGHSMGARMAGDLALALDPPPDGLALLASSTLPSWNVERLEGLRVFMAHGTRDPIFPLEHAIETRDSLRGHGADVTWHEHRGNHSYRLAVDELVLFLSAE